MVQINNQAVIQKLIDELKLYPGTGMIPTELADKILPVFLINSQEITMSVEPSTVVESGVCTSGSPTTIYTVPATGKFFMTNATIESRTNITGASGSLSATYFLTVTPKSGSAKTPLLGVINSYTGANNEDSSANSINLQNPLELEPGSLITVDHNIASASNANARTAATIIGYTKD